VKRRKPENETPSPAVAQGVAEHSRNETRAISYPYSLVSWPHVSHWTVMQPSFPRPSTPPSDASDKPMGSPATPPSTFVLRPATFASPLSPANESQPSDDPPPTPPSPVPQLQPPPAESRPLPSVYPHVSFTPTLSPPRYGERTRKQVIRFKTLPATTGYNQAASAGSPAPVISSTSTSTSSTVDPTNPAGSTSVSAPPITEGRRVPEGAIDAPPSIRGKYAKAGATQRGWSLYVGARSCSVILRLRVVLTFIQMYIYIGDRAPHALSLRQVQTGRCHLFRSGGRAVWALPCDSKTLFTQHTASAINLQIGSPWRKFYVVAFGFYCRGGPCVIVC